MAASQGGGHANFAWNFMWSFWQIRLRRGSQFWYKQTDKLLVTAFPELNHSRQHLYEIYPLVCTWSAALIGGAWWCVMARAHAGTLPTFVWERLIVCLAIIHFGRRERRPIQEFTLENCVRKSIFTLKYTLYLPDADFVSWMQLSYCICSFYQSLICLIFTPSSFERIMLL